MDDDAPRRQELEAENTALRQEVARLSEALAHAYDVIGHALNPKPRAGRSLD